MSYGEMWEEKWAMVTSEVWADLLKSSETGGEKELPLGAPPWSRGALYVRITPQHRLIQQKIQLITRFQTYINCVLLLKMNTYPPAALALLTCIGATLCTLYMQLAL